MGSLPVSTPLSLPTYYYPLVGRVGKTEDEVDVLSNLEWTSALSNDVVTFSASRKFQRRAAIQNLLGFDSQKYIRRPSRTDPASVDAMNRILLVVLMSLLVILPSSRSFDPFRLSAASRSPSRPFLSKLLTSRNQEPIMFPTGSSQPSLFW